MGNPDGYLAILTAVVQRQFWVLGAEKALAGAREAGLAVLANGTVESFAGDGNGVTKRLIECYVGYIGVTAKIGCVMLAKKKLPGNTALRYPIYKTV